MTSKNKTSILILVFCIFLVVGFFVTSMPPQFRDAEFHKAVAENTGTLAVNFPDLPEDCSEFEPDTLSFLQSYCVVFLEPDGSLEIAYEVYGLNPKGNKTVLEISRLEEDSTPMLDNITVDAPGQYSTTVDGLDDGDIVGLVFKESYPEEGQVDLAKIITVMKLVKE